MKMEVGCFRFVARQKILELALPQQPYQRPTWFEADSQIYGGVVLSKSIGDVMRVICLCRA